MSYYFMRILCVYYWLYATRAPLELGWLVGVLVRGEAAPWGSGY